MTARAANLSRHPAGASPDGNRAAIRTVDLTKRFGAVTAVDQVSMSVAPGEIYGFLGRNGAGKTTTIRMLVGLVRPTSGRVLVHGRDVARHRREVARGVGALVETATAYGHLTVVENLEIQRRLTRSTSGAVDRVVALLGLGELVDRRADRLSLGNKQRLAIARAMLARPRLLFLDEPANGLDPAGIVEIRHLLRRLADEDGVTVFLSSHILAEVAQLVDRIGIIHRGRLIEEIDLNAAATAARLEIKVADAAAARSALTSALGIAGDQIRQLAPGTLSVASAEVPASAIVRTLVLAGLDVEAVCPRHEDLEAHFLRLTGDTP